ncbi:MAG: hypothetical protein ABIF40_00445 [archaeon]
MINKVYSTSAYLFATGSVLNSGTCILLTLNEDYPLAISLGGLSLVSAGLAYGCQWIGKDSNQPNELEQIAESE